MTLVTYFVYKKRLKTHVVLTKELARYNLYSKTGYGSITIYILCISGIHCKILHKMADMSQVEQGVEETGKKVLIAIDGSKHSIFAFEWYAEKIHKPGDHVLLGFCSEIGTHLPPAASQTSPATLHALISKHEGKAEEIFSTFDSLATKHNIEHKLQRLHDPPGASVVKYAHENNVDLIVAGSRGHGALRRTILGSVSDYIVHHSHVPVVICKHHDEHHKLK